MDDLQQLVASLPEQYLQSNRCWLRLCGAACVGCSLASADAATLCCLGCLQPRAC